MKNLFIVLLLFSCMAKTQVENAEVEEKIDETGNNASQLSSLDEKDQIDCIKCDINKAVDIKYRKDYSDQTIKLFICSFHQDCEEDVEFSQLSNESLFLALEHNPKTTLGILMGLSESTPQVILESIENPVSDTIDLNEVKKSINDGVNESEIKKVILQSLDTALSKY